MCNEVNISLFSKNYFNFVNRVFFILIILLSFKNSLLKASYTEAKENKVIIEAFGSPKLVLDKSTYDLGDIKPNSTNTAYFNLSNAGEKILIIKNVEKCCGAVVKLGKNELAPGKNTVMEIDYRSRGDEEKLKRTITIMTNELYPFTTLTITGNVIKTLKWEPATFEIPSFKENVECPEIKIKSLDNTKFSVSNFACTFQCISADYDPNFIATEITLKPKIIAEKIKELVSIQGLISIELNHPNYSKIDINFNIIHSLQAKPEQLTLLDVMANKPIIKSFEIKDNLSHDNTDITDQIESIVSENNCIKAQVVKSVTNEKNNKVDIEIMPLENKDYKKISIKDKLIVKMKDGRSLNIPIRIYYVTQARLNHANF